jgi:hypothetical protein
MDSGGVMQPASLAGASGWIAGFAGRTQPECASEGRALPKSAAHHPEQSPRKIDGVWIAAA